MKFRYKLPTYMKAVLITVSVMLILSASYTLLKMIGVFAQVSGSLVLDVTTVIICLLFAVFSIFLLCISYKVTDKSLFLKLAWIDLFGKKIAVGNILNIVVKKETGKLYISYLGSMPDPIIVEIVIDKSKQEDFAKYLISKNEQIVFFKED